MISVRFFKFTLIPVALMVAAFCSNGVASAATAAPNPAGPCTTHRDVPFGSSSEWLSDQSPGVVTDATNLLFEPAGYRPADNVPLKQWITQHVVIAPAARSFVTSDKGCRDNHIENAFFGVTYAKGTLAGVALPAQYTTSMIRLKRTKKFSEAVVVQGWGIFLDSCGNPIPTRIYIKIYIQKVVKQPTSKSGPTPLTQCTGTIVKVSASQVVCQTQSQSSSTTQSGTTSGQGSPVVNVSVTTQVNVQQNQGQGQGQGQGQQQTQTCATGTTGTYPNCTTPPQPTCATGTMGTYPNCKTPAQPPTVNNLQLQQENDVNSTDVICADVYAPAGDNLTITFNATYGSFAHQVKANSSYGPNGYCDTYTAPSEVPPSGSDPVTVTVYDKTTGLSVTSSPVDEPVVEPSSGTGTFY